ncbi:hypothetical protein FIBSPDRAFT_567285 [Athelia psychrophila]|uniref:Uncharacterized protein n=1 Tax=Athelia psychrophila TaxID=1759441 RepID=A0A166I0C5_9AGAM|nr:hypothetical protein FIBSPDRAFT_567285 [Fibularhizoctonia sp. CBS 109695]
MTTPRHLISDMNYAPAHTSLSIASLGSNRSQDQVFDSRKDITQVDHSRRLPPEMLCEIFLQSLPNNRLDEYDEYVSQALRVTHVCATWRSLGIASPPMWTHLRFVAYSARESEVAEAWLIRSGNHPLTFTVEPSSAAFNLAATQAAWENLLVPQCNRWKDATLFLWEPIPDKITSQLANNLPLLESLSLSAPFDLEIFQGFHVAPELRRVSLQAMGGIQESQLPWNGLTSLDIGKVYAIECFCVLRHLPKLVTLKIKFSWNPSQVTGEDTPHIQLAFLTDIEIDTAEDSFQLALFWDHFTFPSLNHLRLLGTWANDVGCAKFTSMLLRSSTTSPLTSLVLDVGSPLELQDVKKEHLPHILRSASNIKNLTLAGLMYGQVGDANVVETLMISQPMCLVPDLENLALCSDSSIPFAFGNGNLLVNMIESRRKLGALQSVHVTGLAHLDPLLENFDPSSLTKLETFAADGLLTMDGISHLHPPSKPPVELILTSRLRPGKWSMAF